MRYRGIVDGPASAVYGVMLAIIVPLLTWLVAVVE